MSTPRLDPGQTAPATAFQIEAETAETALIRSLLNDLYGKHGSVPSAVPSAATVPEGIPKSPTEPTSPLKLGAGGVPFGSASNPHPELAGGFPSPTTTEHPHVHSAKPTASPAPRLAEAPLETTSGGHDPNSSETYPFGEPRCNGSVFAGNGVNTHAPSATPHSAPNPSALTGDGGPPPALPYSGQSAAVPVTPQPVPSGYPQQSAWTSEQDSPLYFLAKPQKTASTRPAATELERSRAVSTPTSGLSTLNVESVRRDFPALHQRVNGKPLIWLDNAATTHKPKAVIDATSRFYSRDNSNIHRAAHTLAVRSTDLFEGGREKVRQFLGAADSKEIVFVRGTTEAINLVAQSYGRKYIGAGDEILLTELEHHANIVPWQLLAEQVGAKIRVVPINDRGELILDELVKLLNPRTKLVSLAHVSNSLGTVNPVGEIIALAHAHGARVLVDGAQSTPHLPVDVKALNADFYAFSGHKIFGPTGIGALYGKAELLESMPPWQGGGHMIRDVRFENTTYQNAPEKFEAGTPDIGGVVGLSAAIEYLQGVGIPAIAAYEHSLLEYATHALGQVRGLRPIGTAHAKASVLSFVIPGVPNEKIAKHLDQQGIAVRAGHHCAQPAQRHFGLETTVRPSLAFYNTFHEIDALVAALQSLPRS